jgi:hypothetical protein
MFGPRLNTIFASRWKALWWAAGILMTAYCSVPNDDDKPDPLVDLAVSMVKPAASATPSPQQHANPWAKDAPATSG